MIDTTLLFENRAKRTYRIVGKPGEYRYERTEGEFKTTKYIFSRDHARNKDKRVEIAVTSQTLQTKVIELTPMMYPKLDISTLEAIKGM